MVVISVLNRIRRFVGLLVYFYLMPVNRLLVNIQGLEPNEPSGQLSPDQVINP